MKIYLDNGASTMVDPKVVEAMQSYYTKIFGNASSIHEYGEDAKTALEESRKTIAKFIGASPKEIVFTSGGTESNNFALKSIAFSNKDKGNHIITTKVEHDCILHSCKWLESQGFTITYLNVNDKGHVEPDQLRKAITEKTLIVSIIHGNNEIGTIQDLEELYKVCKEKNVLFHTDACQSFTKVPLNVKDVDLITLNAHKIHGPKGVGALYIKKGTNIKAWQHGGGHENDMRSGTENIHGIVGFAKAAELAMNSDHIKKMTEQRDKLILALEEIGMKINGDKEHRLCNNINVCFTGLDGETVGLKLKKYGIASSKGSACSAIGNVKSHVLKAIGMNNDDIDSSLRITLSRFTTDEEIEYTINSIKEIVEKMRKPSLLNKFKNLIAGK